MNKIKVIDLLNMISKGEVVPEKIKFDHQEYEYDDLAKTYYCGMNTLLSNYKFVILNDEVEIIEEKKIPEKLPIGLKQTKDGIFNTIVKDDIQYELNEKEVIICKKIHEIIDYLDYLQSRGDK